MLISSVSMPGGFEVPRDISNLRVRDHKNPDFPSCVDTFGFFPGQLLLGLLTELFNSLDTVTNMLFTVSNRISPIEIFRILTSGDQ